MGKKYSLKHLNIWGCPVEAKPYMSSGNAWLFEDVKFIGRDTIKSFVFE